jgi:hypothetical protein
MEEQNRMYVKFKQMNTTCLQLTVICQRKLYPFYNQEVCANKSTTYSSPRCMFPLGIETIWDYTFSNTVSH